MRLGLEGAVMMIALALGAAAPARAAAPDLLSYQGRLLESGIPASGTRFVDLQLCPGPTGGVCTDLGTTQVTATSGLFKLNFSVPSAIDLSAGPWYLQVSAGSSGTNLQALTPREELTSAPYALYASSAAALSNGAVILRSTSTSVGYAVLDVLDTSGNELMRVQQDGSVGIGALFPSDALEIESQSKPAVSISAFGGSVWSQVKLKSFPSAQGQPFTASPANAKLGEVGFYGSDGTNVAVGVQIISSVSAQGPWSTTNHGAELSILATPGNSTTPGEVVHVASDGVLVHGHVGAVGGTPTLGADCGTGSAIVGNDQGGVLTLSASPGTTCTVMFAKSYQSVPVCVLNNTSSDANAVVAVAAAANTNVSSFKVTAVGNAFAGGEQINYICAGY